MDIQRALATIGLELPTSQPEIKRAYRRAMRAQHPDINRDRWATHRAGEINAAYRWLCDNQRALDVSASSGDANGNDELRVIYARPGGVFDEMLRAAGQLGSLAQADRSSGSIQIELVDGAWNGARLTIDLTDDDETTSALFTLDAARSSPPIDILVGELAKILAGPAR